MSYACISLSFTILFLLSFCLCCISSGLKLIRDLRSNFVCQQNGPLVIKCPLISKHRPTHWSGFIRIDSRVFIANLHHSFRNTRCPFVHWVAKHIVQNGTSFRKVFMLRSSFTFCRQLLKSTIHAGYVFCIWHNSYFRHLLFLLWLCRTAVFVRAPSW